jgi:hypothetical protein
MGIVENRGKINGNLKEPGLAPQPEKTLKSISNCN